MVMCTWNGIYDEVLGRGEVGGAKTAIAFMKPTIELDL